MLRIDDFVLKSTQSIFIISKLWTDNLYGQLRIQRASIQLDQINRPVNDAHGASRHFFLEAETATQHTARTYLHQLHSSFILRIATLSIGFNF